MLPGRVLRVSYEDLVEDLEGNVPRVLDFCGLKFEPACVEFYKTERGIRTASSEAGPPTDFPRRAFALAAL